MGQKTSKVEEKRVDFGGKRDEKRDSEKQELPSAAVAPAATTTTPSVEITLQTPLKRDSVFPFLQGFFANPDFDCAVVLGLSTSDLMKFRWIVDESRSNNDRYFVASKREKGIRYLNVYVSKTAEAMVARGLNPYEMELFMSFDTLQLDKSAFTAGLCSFFVNDAVETLILNHANLSEFVALRDLLTTVAADYKDVEFTTKSVAKSGAFFDFVVTKKKEQKSAIHPPDYEKKRDNSDFVPDE